MPGFEEYCDEIKSLWDNRWLSNAGEKHKEFEERLKDYLGVEYLSLFANGHLALEIAINVFDFPIGSEVITTAYTHCSTTHAIVRNGLKPVFCDIRGTDFTIDPHQIEKYITPKTCAIVATHVYGYACDVDTIQSIADRHNLKIIYDAAHAFGVQINHQGIGQFGDASMFSCHATKVFHTIEGGIVSFKEKQYQDKANRIINFGFLNHEEVGYIGTNARMNEFEAAMGICNLRHIDEEIKRRKQAAERYEEHFAGVAGLRCMNCQDQVSRNYSYFPIVVDRYKVTRDQLQILLAEKSIYSRKYFYPLTSELQCYQGAYIGSLQQTPVAKYIADHILALPMYSDLTEEEVDMICNAILR